MTHFLTPREFALEMGMTTKTIYKWLRTGYIRGERAPGLRTYWRIPRSELTRLKEGR